jgi:F420-non-reducing hydrogenase small subunit
MSAISSIIDAKEPDDIEKVLEDLVDTAGTFYRFSLPSSMIRRKMI